MACQKGSFAKSDRKSLDKPTNKHTHGGGDFERGGSYGIWLNCVDKRNGQFEGVVSPLGGTSGGYSTWAVWRRGKKIKRFKRRGDERKMGRRGRKTRKTTGVKVRL